jgi:hypothetical protein
MKHLSSLVRRRSNRSRKQITWFFPPLSFSVSSYSIPKFHPQIQNSQAPSKKAPSRSMSIKIPIYTNYFPPSPPHQKKVFSGVEIQRQAMQQKLQNPNKLQSTPRLFQSPHPRNKDTVGANNISSGIPPILNSSKFPNALHSAPSSHLKSLRCAARSHHILLPAHYPVTRLPPLLLPLLCLHLHLLLARLLPRHDQDLKSVDAALQRSVLFDQVSIPLFQMRDVFCGFGENSRLDFVLAKLLYL